MIVLVMDDLEARDGLLLDVELLAGDGIGTSPDNIRGRDVVLFRIPLVALLSSFHRRLGHISDMHSGEHSWLRTNGNIWCVHVDAAMEQAEQQASSQSASWLC